MKVVIEYYAAGIRRRQSCDFRTFLFDEKCFAKVKDIFYSGPFLTVEGKLADILSRFDLGEGGLIPFTIYEADLITPLDREVFLVNFGTRKNSIVPEKCEDARKFVVEKKTGRQIWHINKLNPTGEVVLSPAAIDGPDLWFEEAVHNRIFIKDALAQALIEIGMGDVFKLTPCRIVDGKPG